MKEKYYYWLHNVPGIGKMTFQKILRYMTPEELYKCSLEKTFDFLTEKQRDSIKQSKKHWDIQKEWEILKKKNINLLIYGEEAYPWKLSKISDPPPLLYHKGKADILDKPSVAVIGARACSNYGSLAAKELGRELAAVGIVVVSGMARGIDGICQWASLENKGESIGVLGSGVEVCYPPENRRLYERLQTEGCVVSENAPFIPPSPGLFPLRNRIISGLADVVVVVESREKSGTLITVDMALEQGKEVYAMPGRITDSVSRGCNKLIKQGAGLILSPEEFIEEICPILSRKYQKMGEEKSPVLSLKNQKVSTMLGGQVTQNEKMILKILDVSLKTIDEIYQIAKTERQEITINQVMEIVLGLQLKNILKEESGYYGLKRSLGCLMESFVSIENQ